MMCSSISGIWIVILLTVCTSAKGAAQLSERHVTCETFSIPNLQYHLAVRNHGAAPSHRLLLQIAITPEQTGNESALIRLGCQLQADFPNEADIEALIFDDKESAQKLRLYATDQRDHAKYLWHVRARYELDRREKRRVIDFLIPEAEDGLLVLKKYRTWIDF